MVFHRNFVVAVKTGGKYLREKDDHTVRLPFGSEYSLLLKNLDSRRAVVKVEIDGVDVLNGRRLIVEPNSRQELERFLDDDLKEGRRFRFIQKTKEIVEHRGDRLEDGIIRVEYWFEQPYRSYTWNIWGAPWYITCSPPLNFWHDHNTVYGSMGGGGGTLSCAAHNAPAPHEGITVPGSPSSQEFQSGWVGQLEPNSQVITLRLRGYQVDQPLYARGKISCPTCGRQSRSSASFCSRCGTALS